MIMGATLKALFREVGLHHISNLDIAQAIPSRATLAATEIQGAADSLIGVCQDIKDDQAASGKIRLGVVADHGHRAGGRH